MNELKYLNQIKVGSKLKILGICKDDDYISISVKKIIKCENKDRTWHEVIIDKTKNYYFDFERYLEGKSRWVSMIYVID